MSQRPFAGLGLASFLVAASAAFCSACSGDNHVRADLLLVGHRGAPNVAAENTLPSFRAAAQQGANAIETDLCVTKDDRIVLWHDCDPDSVQAIARQSGSEGLLYVPVVPSLGSPMRRPLRELTLDEVRTYYGYSKPLSDRDPNARIPELGELFEWISTEAPLRALYLDIKLESGQTSLATFLVEQVHKALPENELGTTYLLSVHEDIARVMEEKRIELDTKALRVVFDFEESGAEKGADRLGLRDITTGYTVTREWGEFTSEVEELVLARDRGELDSVTVWTLDDPDEQDELLRMGVNGLMTDEPGALRDVFNEVLADANGE